MSRGQSSQIADQGINLSKQGQGVAGQNAANAQQSFGDTNKSIGDFNDNLKSYMNFGNDTYGVGGEFAKDQNVAANTAASAANRATAANLALNAGRTGANTAGYADTLAESERQGSRDMTAELARADQERLQNLTGIKNTGLEASKFPAQLQAQLYGVGTGGTTSALGAASSALNPAQAASASAPSFGDWLANFAMQGAKTGGEIAAHA